MSERSMPAGTRDLVCPKCGHVRYRAEEYHPRAYCFLIHVGINPARIHRAFKRTAE